MVKRNGLGNWAAWGPIPYRLPGVGSGGGPQMLENCHNKISLIYFYIFIFQYKRRKRYSWRHEDRWWVFVGPTGLGPHAI